MNKKKAIFVALASVAAGAMLGVLLASDKGSGARKKIIRRGGDLADALNDKIDEKFNELCTAVTGKVDRSEHSAALAREKQFTE